MNEERIKVLESDIFDLMKEIEYTRKNPGTITSYDQNDNKTVKLDYRLYMDFVNIFISNERQYLNYFRDFTIDELSNTIISKIRDWLDNEVIESHNLMKKEEKNNFKAFKCLNKIYLTLLNEVDYIEKMFKKPKIINKRY